MYKFGKVNWLFFGIVALILVSPDLFASSSSGLAWEGPLDKVVSSIKGPVAFGISIVAIIAVGVGLVFGGEIGTFMKTALYLVLVISLVVLSTNVLSGIFGTSGAMLLINR
ncbi:MAG: TrbC/VirB2 family protein [Endomicrobium sp.]|jgi:type IV secretion system protein VirB2|nr:TrbC/VirB2 family protein [Endomicrobium sp.]